MSTNSTYFNPETLSRLHGLELRAQHIVEGYVSGVHRSPFHGFSIEFAEHREYVAGDDLRYVDWKVFGKTDKFYLKQYEQETNLLAYLLLDTSESMLYQGPKSPLSKLEYAKCLAASLAYLVLQQQDSVGLTVFDNKINQSLRASSNPSHMKQILHVMEHAQPQAQSNTGPIFHDLAERLKKRGVVLIFSDLLDDVPSLLTGLKHFRHRRHEAIVFHVLDPAELDFPFTQMTMFKGLEGLGDVLADCQSLRKGYLEQVNKFCREVQVGCRAQHVDYVQVRTDQPLDVVLRTFLAPRMTKVG